MQSSLKLLIAFAQCDTVSEFLSLFCNAHGGFIRLGGFEFTNLQEGHGKEVVKVTLCMVSLV